jgi:superfamily I DNA/RNA helicase/mRNA-degrading endonuclease RelE of RelBE toxin-antitoxin system
MADVKVVIASDFLDAFAKLPRQIQGKTTEFIIKFKNNPLSKGIHYEKIKDALDDKIYSVRIDDTYRGIVVQEDGVYLLLWVDHHDKAYDWARRKRVEVNKRTGVLQVYEVQVSKETHKVEGIFSAFDDADLLQLGVPEKQLSYVKEMPNKAVFYQSQNSLPADAFENLSWLAEGFPMQEVLDLVRSDQEATDKPATIAASLENPQTQKSFVVVEGEDELKNMMAAPLEKWRVFLHPTQRKLVKKNFNGPARVLGGAGTGKTVVAMHRAKALAAKLKDREKLLFTTFTANLAQDIRDNLRKICSTEGMRHIEVVNFDAWVASFLRENGYTARIIYGDEVQKLWNRALDNAQVEGGFEESFYQEEWSRVVEAQETYTPEAYMRASRKGRGTQLNRKKRIEVWKVFDEYMKLMKIERVRDINYAMYECSKLVQKVPEALRYKHIVVDEGQDLSPSAYRLMRTMMGEEKPNDIFIVGDAHQRIYENRASLSACGINIRGRSSILRINYRTTEEIRRYAFALLDGVSFDDMDEGIDTGDRCQSLTHGLAPTIKFFKGAAQELDFIDSEIRKLQEQGVDLRNICLVARTNKLVESYQSELTQRGYHVYEIKSSKSDDRQHDGLRVATMHRVKGLEFQYVFVVAVNDRIVPLHSAIKHTDKIAESESMTAEKCLLYVALTRARQGAYICSYGRKSSFLK